VPKASLSQFDFVISTLSGSHPRRINKISDRAYFILSGSAEVTVGDETHRAETHDLILIPANTPHSIAGKAEFIIITAPPYAPQNEERV
jgi:mannose-6-phosphate isomerase-like protein (cupin superfamily)